MSLPLLIACIALSVPINLAMNGLWLWFAVRIAGAAKSRYIRAFLVALTISAAFFLVGVLAPVFHPALVLLTFPAAIALGVWLVRRAFTLSRWRASGALAAMLAASIAVNLTFALIVRTFWLTAFVISSGSMAPTFKIGDRFVADRTLAPERWDCIVFHPAESPTQAWVKRLVGLPGETITLRGGAIFINEREAPLPENYSGHRFDTLDRDTHTPHRGTTDGPITLGPDEFFVIGDNVEQSMDSRNWSQNYGPNVHPGTVPRSALIGVARAIYAPPDNARLFR